MKISIITASYNCAASIAGTLRSVAEQDHEDIEHILVDGGSTDGTVAVAKANAGRLAHIISERDDGVYDAFNKGLRRASGDAIAFLGSGDTYTSARAVSRLANALSGAGVQAAFSDALIVDAEHHERVIRRYRSRSFSPKLMPYGFMPAHPSLFVRREVYQRIGEYNTEFRIAADFELCLRLFLRNRTIYRCLHEPMVRMPTGGLSNRGWSSKLQITREMRRACEMNEVKTNLAKLSLRFPIKLLEMI
jgi:glycosyltransferase involved in cell wall biosynthesis